MVKVLQHFLKKRKEHSVNNKEKKHVILKKLGLSTRSAIMKNQLIKTEKNVANTSVKRVAFYLVCMSVGSMSLHAGRTYISSADQEQTKTSQQPSKTSTAATVDKLKGLCDKIGLVSESTLQRYSELKNIKDELHKTLKNNPQRDLVFKGGQIDCIALKSIADSLNKDEVARAYDLLLSCDKLKEKKIQNLKSAVNEIRRTYGDNEELRSIESEVQVIESSFVEFDAVLRRLEAHEKGMNDIRGISKDGQKKDKGVMDTVMQKAGSALEKTKDFFVGSEKEKPRRVKQGKYYRDKKRGVDTTLRSDSHDRELAQGTSQVLTQHKDIVEKTVEDARRDIAEISNEVVELREEAVDLYRQAIEKEVLAQQKAFEKAELLRQQAEQLSEEAEFLLRQAEELEKKPRGEV